LFAIGRFLVGSQSIAVAAKVYLVSRLARVYKDVRHHTDILKMVVVVIVVAHLNGLEISLSICRDHVEVGMLGIVYEVFLNLLSQCLITKRETLIVVLQAKLVKELLVFIPELVEQPDVSIRGE
jgi:hypothetical protein